MYQFIHWKHHLSCFYPFLREFPMQSVSMVFLLLSALLTWFFYPQYCKIMYASVLIWSSPLLFSWPYRCASSPPQYLSTCRPPLNMGSRLKSEKGRSRTDFLYLEGMRHTIRSLFQPFILCLFPLIFFSPAPKIT